jgi:hypothetical protein
MATSNRLMLRYGLVLVGAFALAQPAWAQLFGNTAELTRQIQALQQQANAVDARLGKLEVAIQQNPQLLDLLKEVELLKAEVARLRGQPKFNASTGHAGQTAKRFVRRPRPAHRGSRQGAPTAPAARAARRRPRFAGADAAACGG